MQLYSVCNSVLTLCCCFFFLQYYSSNCSSLHYDNEVGLGQDPFLKFFRENANYSVGGEQKERKCERERGEDRNGPNWIIWIHQPIYCTTHQRIGGNGEPSSLLSTQYNSYSCTCTHAGMPRWKRQRDRWTAAANWNFIVTVKLFNWFSKFPIGGVSLLLGQLFRPSVRPYDYGIDLCVSRQLYEVL